MQWQVPAGHEPGTLARQLWALDGKTAFAVAAEAGRLVAAEFSTPPPVLLAVSDGHTIDTPGNRRGHDYTPVPSSQRWARRDSGAAAWLEELRERVLPAVAARVGPARERLLYDNSYGGLA